MPSATGMVTPSFSAGSRWALTGKLGWDVDPAGRRSLSSASTRATRALRELTEETGLTSARSSSLLDVDSWAWTLRGPRATVSSTDFHGTASSTACASQAANSAIEVDGSSDTCAWIQRSELDSSSAGGAGQRSVFVWPGVAEDRAAAHRCRLLAGLWPTLSFIHSCCATTRSRRRTARSVRSASSARSTSPGCSATHGRCFIVAILEAYTRCARADVPGDQHRAGKSHPPAGSATADRGAAQCDHRQHRGRPEGDADRGDRALPDRGPLRRPDPRQQPVPGQPDPAADARATPDGLTPDGRPTFNAHDESRCERAFYASDPTWDGRFVAAVRTTGIFCRPSCRVRKPLPTQRRASWPMRAAARAAGLSALPALPARRSATPVTLRDIDTPIGPMTIGATERAVVLCRLQRAADDAVPARVRAPSDRPDELRRRAAARPRRAASCGEYFAGSRDAVRPAARSCRAAPSSERVWTELRRDPVRRDDQLPRAGRARRCRERLSRRGPGQRLESAGGHRALPPRDRGRRRARRLRRGPGREALRCLDLEAGQRRAAWRRYSAEVIGVGAPMAW